MTYRHADKYLYAAIILLVVGLAYEAACRMAHWAGWGR